MSANYNTETIQAQFINQSFLEKVENGMDKEASAAMSAFVRQKLREEGWTRKILTPVPLTNADLDRQTTEEPTVIVEKEPDSIAANIPFVGRPNIRYFKGARYPVSFNKIESVEFKKSKYELATYRTDIRTVLQENSVKDLQTQEDQNFYNNVTEIATANSNVFNLSGGLTVANVMAGVKKLLAHQLPVGVILMTQSTYADLMSQPATQVGSPLASSLMNGDSNLESFYQMPIVTTIKNDILPDNQFIVFTKQQYLGQFYVLQDATIYLKQEADIISFTAYESIGAGIGNVNGAVVINI